MTDEQQEVRFGWGKYFAQAKGSFVAPALILLLGVAFLEYQHKGRSDAAEKQHDAIVEALQVQTCIQSVPFEDRKTLREDLKKATNPLETLRLGWCPWMEKLNNKGKR